MPHRSRSSPKRNRSSGKGGEKLLKVLARLGFTPIEEAASKSNASLPLPPKVTKALQTAAAHGDYLAQALLSHWPQLAPFLLQHPTTARRLYAVTPRRSGSVVSGHIIGPYHPYLAAYAMFTALEAAAALHPQSSLTLSCNTMGDEESLQTYLREVQGGIRRILGALSPSLQALIRTEGPAGVWALSSLQHPSLFDLPKPLECLSAPSRATLQETLDILEGNNLPYEIDELLIFHPVAFSQNVFEVRVSSQSDGWEGVARGATAGSWVLRFVNTDDAPPPSIVSFAFHLREPAPSARPLPPHRAKVLFAPIGKEARTVALEAIRLLSRSRIPFTTTIAYGKFCDTIAAAERQRIPYVAIIGSPEAQRRMVLIRRMEDRAQREVSLDELVPFLNRIEVMWDAL